jgi:hypothetical protein
LATSDQLLTSVSRGLSQNAKHQNHQTNHTHHILSFIHLPGNLPHCYSTEALGKNESMHDYLELLELSIYTKESGSERQDGEVAPTRGSGKLPTSGRSKAESGNGPVRERGNREVALT